MNSKNIAILFLSHVAHSLILDEYRKIMVAMEHAAVSYFLFHNKNGACPVMGNQDRIALFSNDDLAALKYLSIAKSIIPGSAHFPLLHFFSKNPSYNYYWIIEYDVRFSGDWRLFFDSFQDNNADLLTCYIRNHSDEPGWSWWHRISHPQKSIPLEKRLHSFNPVYRISNSALRYIHQSHCDTWCGHFEVLMPTLLYHGGFKLEDIGGSGRFVPAGQKNKFYTEGPKGTFKWRPVFSQIGMEKDKLYHPVKLPQ